MIQPDLTHQHQQDVEQSSRPDSEQVSEQHGGQRSVTVIGASGYIGTHLVPRLVREGWQVRATSRNLAVLEARHWPDVELFEADILDQDSLEHALKGSDTVFYLVHCMAAGGDFGALERQGAENLSRASEATGVSRIVYLGGLAPPDTHSPHLLARLETGRILRTGRAQVIEIRAGMIVGPGSAAWEVIRDLVNHLPIMITPRWVRSRSTPIALENLLVYLTGVAKMPLQGDLILEVGGPEAYTYEQMMRIYGDLVDRPPRILDVPLLTPTLSSYWLRLITSVPSRVAGALIQGLSHDLIADDAEIRRLIPQQLLTFRESAIAALEAEKTNTVETRWVEGSMACRDWNPNYGFYAMRAGDEAQTSASIDALWQEVQLIGKDGDFFYANTLWRIRRLIDWSIGGESIRRRRRHPSELQVGDAFDGWRVIGMQERKRLTLLMEMKAPGGGVLELEITEGQSLNTVRATAYWHPAGSWGIAYWYSLLPAHAILFKGLTRSIARRAEARRLPPPDADSIAHDNGKA